MPMMEYEQTFKEIILGVNRRGALVQIVKLLLFDLVGLSRKNNLL